MKEGRLSKGQMQIAAMPFRHGEHGVEILLITTRDTGRWIVPKGWPHKGKTFPDSAACEALEEGGVAGQMFREALGSYWYDKRLETGAILTCEVMVYPLWVDQQLSSWREIGQRERRWFTVDEAERLVEPTLRPLFARLLQRLSVESAGPALSHHRLGLTQVDGHQL
jgi:8-oxo-dGTP pyrophosphatase MutT (NUDIX family)